MPGELGDRLLVAAAGFFHDVVDAAGQQIGIGKAGTHRIDSHARACKLQRQRAHQPDHRMFCSTIGADIGIAFQSGGRGDSDNAAVTPVPHRRQRGLDGMNHAHEVDIHHSPKKCCIGFSERG